MFSQLDGVSLPMRNTTYIDFKIFIIILSIFKIFINYIEIIYALLRFSDFKRGHLHHTFDMFALELCF